MRPATVAPVHREKMSARRAPLELFAPRRLASKQRPLVGSRRTLAGGARGAGRPGAATIAEVASWIFFVPALVILLTLGARGVALALTLSCAVSLVVLVIATVGVSRQQGRQARVAGTVVESA